MRDAEHGKRSLFESATPPAPTTDEPFAVSIDCSRCGQTSTVGAVDALRRLVALSLWIPGLSHSRRLRCPSCHRRSWVKVSLA